MKTKLFLAIAGLLGSQTGQAFACSVCFGAPGSKSSESMAIAIWFLMAAVMAVLGGIGAFSFHLWRHAKMPLEPYQELTDEDLKQYD
jgi:hypothetical protein